MRQARRSVVWCASSNHPTATRFATGLTTFSYHRFQRLDVQCLLGDDMFQPPVLVLELLEPLHLTQLHAAVLRLPPVVGLLGDPIGATEVGDFPPGLAFFDDR